MGYAKCVIATFISLVLALFLAAMLTVLPKRLAFDGADKYSFFTGNTSLNCREVRVDGSEAAIARLALTEVCGESATYSTLDLDEFLNKVGGKVLFVETLSDSVNYYCTADLPYSVQLYGQTVNLHVCVKESGTTVASPIIFGGY